METLSIGAAGELLVQYKLLKHGIDSARLTTDTGVDLVMYVPGSKRAATIQVKSVHLAGPAGGKGKNAIGWRFKACEPAEWLACTHVETDSAWLFTMQTAYELAQGRRADGSCLLYWYTDESRPPSSPLRRSEGRRRLRPQLPSAKPVTHTTALPYDP